MELLSCSLRVHSSVPSAISPSTMHRNAGMQWADTQLTALLLPEHAKAIQKGLSGPCCCQTACKAAASLVPACC